MKEIFSIISSLIKDYFEGEFPKKKKSTRVIIIIISLLLTKMIWDIYSGYSKELKITDVIVSMPLTSLFIELIIPAFLLLFFVVLILKQIKETMPENFPLYYFKISCCLQVYFYIIFIILRRLILNETFSILTGISIFICILIVIRFFSLYYINNGLIKKINEAQGAKRKRLEIKYICHLYIAYSLCIWLIIPDLSFTVQIVVIIALLSVVSYGNFFSIDNINFIRDFDDKILEKYFFTYDSPFYCMYTILCILIVGFLFFKLNFEDVGRSAATFESTYMEINAGVEFKSHKNANGYLLFKTINKKNIAIAYQKCDEEGKVSKYAKGNYIKILKGYKYVDLDDLEISEHNYTVKASK